jgi:hypothetical protein
MLASFFVLAIDRLEPDEPVPLVLLTFNGLWRKRNQWIREVDRNFASTTKN